MPLATKLCHGPSTQRSKVSSSPRYTTRCDARRGARSSRIAAAPGAGGAATPLTRRSTGARWQRRARRIADEADRLAQRLPAARREDPMVGRHGDALAVGERDVVDGPHAARDDVGDAADGERPGGLVEHPERRVRELARRSPAAPVGVQVGDRAASRPRRRASVGRAKATGVSPRQATHPVAEPLARHEDRAADVEAERVVLERRAVRLAHQEADQARVALVHLLLAHAERDARRVDDGEVVGHRAVEADEAVVEDVDAILLTHA